MSDAGEAIVREAFEMWDAVIAIEMVDPADTPDPADDAVRPLLQAGGSTAPAPAWAYGPGLFEASGDAWFDIEQSFMQRLAGGPAPYRGSYEGATALHEVGHSLGLKHPHQGWALLDRAYDGLEYTVMSYRSYVGGPTGAYTVQDGSYPQSLMMLDIAMAQDHYGADYATLSGDTVYTFDTATGEMVVDGAGVGAGVTNKVFRTLWDGGGTDLIDLSNYTTDLAIDLRPGESIDLDVGGFAQRALLDRFDDIYAPRHIYMSLLYQGDIRSLIENATGGSGDDVFIGNQADNTFIGGAGDDLLTGALGADTFVLGAGADTVSDTLAGLDGDTILDFDPATDRIVILGTVLTADMLSYDALAGVLRIDAGGAGEAAIAVDLDLNAIQMLSDGQDTLLSGAPSDALDRGPTALLIGADTFEILDDRVTDNDFGTAEISPDGTALTVAENGWKVAMMDLTITADTVLSFEFSAEALGEIHGIGFASGDDLQGESFFALAGSQTHYGIQDYNGLYMGGVQTYEIAVGDYLAGQSFDRLVLTADDDRDAAGISTFANIEIA